MTGEEKLDARAILDYFAVLKQWLVEQNMKRWSSAVASSRSIMTISRHRLRIGTRCEKFSWQTHTG